jgi:phosphoglucomutase
VETEKADALVAHLRAVIADPSTADFGPFPLKTADEFEYVDPVDGSVAKNQGFRFVFEDGSRIIFRLSGTGSAGATIRWVGKA